MKLSDYFNFYGIVYGFFMFFFIFFIGKFGFTNLILESTNNWNELFNIGVWFVLVMFCMNEFFSGAERAEKRRVEKQKDNQKTKTLLNKKGVNK